MIFIRPDDTLINIEAIQTVAEWVDQAALTSDTARFTRIGLHGGEAYLTRKTVDEVVDMIHAAENAAHTEDRAEGFIEPPIELSWKDESLPPENPVCGRRDCDEQGQHGHVVVDEARLAQKHGTKSAAELLREKRRREGRPFFEDRDPNRVSERSTLGVLDPDYVAPDPAPRSYDQIPVYGGPHLASCPPNDGSGQATASDRYREGQLRALTSMRDLIKVHRYGASELLSVIEADLEQGR